MFPPGVTTSTRGSQSQYVAHAPAVVGDNTKIPAASMVATSTLFIVHPSEN